MLQHPVFSFGTLTPADLDYRQPLSSTSTTASDVSSRNKKELGVLKFDELQLLLQAWPTNEEVKAMRDLQSKVELGSLELHSTDTIALKLCDEHSLLQDKLRTAILRVSTELEARRLGLFIAQLREAATELNDTLSDSLKQVLHLILQIGNFINHGSYAGNALGFKVESLLLLREYWSVPSKKKGVDSKRTNLLQVVAQTVQKSPETMSSLERLHTALSSVTELDFDVLTADVASLTADVDELNAQAAKLMEANSNLSDAGISRDDLWSMRFAPRAILYAGWINDATDLLRKNLCRVTNEFLKCARVLGEPGNTNTLAFTRPLKSFLQGLRTCWDSKAPPIQMVKPKPIATPQIPQCKTALAHTPNASTRFVQTDYKLDLRKESQTGLRALLEVLASEDSYLHTISAAGENQRDPSPRSTRTPFFRLLTSRNSVSGNCRSTPATHIPTPLTSKTGFDVAITDSNGFSTPTRQSIKRVRIGEMICVGSTPSSGVSHLASTEPASEQPHDEKLRPKRSVETATGDDDSALGPKTGDSSDVKSSVGSDCSACAIVNMLTNLQRGGDLAADRPKAPSTNLFTEFICWSIGLVISSTILKIWNQLQLVKKILGKLQVSFDPDGLLGESGYPKRRTKSSTIDNESMAFVPLNIYSKSGERVYLRHVSCPMAISESRTPVTQLVPYSLDELDHRCIYRVYGC